MANKPAKKNPKITAGKLLKIAEKDAQAVSDEKLKISFEYMDWDTEEFFFHGLEREFYIKFFKCLTEIQKSSEGQVREQTHPSLSPKSIFNKNGTKNDFPASVINKVADKLFLQIRDRTLANNEAISITSKMAFEVRVTKSDGRLHGFIWNNIFHIVWIDPAHNLYPQNKYGIRKQEDYATVKTFSANEFIRLKNELEKCQKEYDELFSEWASTESNKQK